MSTAETYYRIHQGNCREIHALIDCEELNKEYFPLESTYIIDYNCKIESLVASIYLPSLEQAPIAAINIEDSYAERNIKSREIEEKYPKYGLSFHYWDASKNSWDPEPRATVIIQNRGAEYHLACLSPHLTIGEVKFLEKRSKLGVNITPFDDGLLKEGDYVRISCDYNHHNELEPKPVDELRQTQNIGFDIGTEAIMICPFRPTRGNVWLQNDGPERIHLWWGDSSGLQPGSCPYLDPQAMASYESSKYRMPQAIWAKTVKGQSRIQGMEAY